MILLGLMMACGKDPAMVVAGIESQNPVIREDMVLIARNVEDPAVTAALVGALDDSSPTIRQRAIESLARLGDPAVAPEIVARLQDEEAEIRRAAVDALGKLGNPETVQPLLAYVETTSPPPLNALWALGELGSAEAIPLLGTLRESDDPYIAYNSDVALRKLPAR